MEYSIQFPNPLTADDEGLIAVGGDLSVEYLISAYAQGIFPWFNEGSQILWWSPNPRLVLFPHEFKLKKSLKQLIKQKKYTVKIDADFESVIHNCSNVNRPGQDGTWITREMKRAYLKLHEIGIAHSFESYNQQGDLVGGLYGLSLGNAFFGESMFYKERDTSKVALARLVDWCKLNNMSFIDAQQSTSHMISLGASEIDRKDFIEMLDKALQKESILGKWS